MGALRTHHVLVWQAKLAAHGYTCWELVDEFGVRWGWVVNAAASGWTAHTGDFGQAATIDQPSPPVADRAVHFKDASPARAREWVEEQVAVAWREASL